MMARLTLLLLAASACARPHGPTTPRHDAEVRELEEVRITADRQENGEYELEAYDAETLFQRGVRESQEGRCTDGVAFYERVVREFPSSRYVSPSHYNTALCLKEQGDLAAAAARFERLLQEQPDSPDALHARFQLVELQLGLERWDAGLLTVAGLLAEDDLSTDERAEAMARQAQLLLGARELERARTQAEDTLRFGRLRPDDDRVRDPYWLGAANYVLAETMRLEAEAIELPPGGVAIQRPVLERRAQLILDAQREYFDTIRHSNADWAAAAGYRIGELYDSFWDAVMSAPVPPPQSALPEDHLAVYEEEYRVALARLVKPLIRHSIRYWELTLLMVERTGVDSPWTDRIRRDLDLARTRLLEQPDGPEGIDAVGRTRELTQQRLDDRAARGELEEPTESRQGAGDDGNDSAPETPPETGSESP